MPRAVVLFSGGLDSMLCVRIMQQQGFDVEALNIRTIFSCCEATASQTATALGARLTVVSVDDDYVEVLRNPVYGYGKGVNPCVDCRAYMCRMGKRFMEEIGASVIVSGEVLGQRPMSQKRHQLDLVVRCSGLQGRLLRPLSAQLLPPTDAETEGLVDRERLYAFSGRSRRPLIDLANELGILESGVPLLPTPSTGCALTDTCFAPRVRDLMDLHPTATRWDFELLNYGRHFRLNEQTKIVVGRNESENASLEVLADREDAPQRAFLDPDNFRGPAALVVGCVDEAGLRFAEALVMRYTRAEYHQGAEIRIDHGGASRVVEAVASEAAESATSL